MRRKAREKAECAEQNTRRVGSNALISIVLRRRKLNDVRGALKQTADGNEAAPY